MGSRDGEGKEGKGGRKGSQMLSDFWLDKHVVVLSFPGDPQEPVWQGWTSKGEPTLESVVSGVLRGHG